MTTQLSELIKRADKAAIVRFSTDENTDRTNSCSLETYDGPGDPANVVPCRYTILAAGPIWSGGKQNEALRLYRCYQDVLAMAKQNEIRTIGLPSKISGFPDKMAALVAQGAVEDFLMQHPGSFEKIIWIFPDTAAKQTFDILMN